VAVFQTPVQMTLPNFLNVAPGTKLNFLSFDHTTGRLVIDGTATVSADGKSVTTDPGTGITHPGWHGLPPPRGPGGPPCPPLPHTTNRPPIPEVPTEQGIGAVHDYFFKDDDKGTYFIDIANLAKKTDDSRDPCDPVNADATPLDVDITVDSRVNEFLTGL